MIDRRDAAKARTGVGAMTRSAHADAALASATTRRSFEHDRLPRRQKACLTRDDIACLKADIRVDLANFKAEIIKWVAGMFVVQTTFVLTAIDVLLKLCH